MKRSAAPELDPRQWQLWKIDDPERKAAWIWEFSRELLDRRPEVARLQVIGGIERDAPAWSRLPTPQRDLLCQLAEVEVRVECSGREANADFLGPAAARFYPSGVDGKSEYVRAFAAAEEAGLSSGSLDPLHVEGFAIAINWQWSRERILEEIDRELLHRERDHRAAIGSAPGMGRFSSSVLHWQKALIRLGQMRLYRHAKLVRGEKQPREWSAETWNRTEDIPHTADNRDFTRANTRVSKMLEKFAASLL